MSPLSDGSSLVLTLFWLLAAVGWAVWRVWSKPTSWRRTAVEAGLLAVVVLVCLSALAAARYKHAAWLIAWEWFVLVVVFCLVRQLALTQEDNRRLLAVLLASGVSLSVYAIYQYHFELPGQRELLSNPAKLREALNRVGLPRSEDAGLLVERMKQGNVFATFAHPNSFAGYEALLLPPAAAAAWFCWRRRTWSATLGVEGGTLLLGIAWLLTSLFVPWGLLAWVIWIPLLVATAFWMLVLVTSGFVPAGFFALLIAAALWLTHSRGAILASIVVGLGVCVISGRRILWKYKGWVLAGLLVLIGAGMAAYSRGWESAAIDKAWRSWTLRRDYWTATWGMIREHLWLGVGPGNFSRYYPRYMLPTAFEQLSDPHNFLLELWATCGVFALAALVITLAAFFRRARFGWIDDEPSAEGKQTRQPSGAAAPALTLSQSWGRAGGEGWEFQPRWEFYLGGMAGLTLGFLLWASGVSGQTAADQILVGGVLSGVRSLVWFVTFALLEGVPWSGAVRARVLTAGVAVLLLHLLVSGGLSFPSLAQPLWFAAALALNAVPSEIRRQGSGDRGQETGTDSWHLTPDPCWLRVPWLGRALPLPLLGALCLGYFLFVFEPAWQCARLLSAARPHYGNYLGEKLRALDKKAPEERQQVLQEAFGKLGKLILEPLAAAMKSDPGDVNPKLEFAHWYQERLSYYRDLSGDDNMERLIRQIKEIDPENKEAYLAEYRLRSAFGPVQQGPRDRQQTYQAAAKALAQAVERDPTAAGLRYQLAEALFSAEDAKGGRQQAEKALQLDGLATEPSRHLTTAQKQQIDEWLRRSS